MQVAALGAGVPRAPVPRCAGCDVWAVKLCCLVGQLVLRNFGFCAVSGQLQAVSPCGPDASASWRAGRLVSAGG